MAGMNPNPHVLVVVEKPAEKDSQHWQNWETLQRDLKNNPQSLEAGERLTETVWQFPVPSALTSANCFLAKVRTWGLDSKMFYSASKIEECK
jgi:hypothetical protein